MITQQVKALVASQPEEERMDLQKVFSDLHTDTHRHIQMHACVHTVITFSVFYWHPTTPSVYSHLWLISPWNSPTGLSKPVTEPICPHLLKSFLCAL